MTEDRATREPARHGGSGLDIGRDRGSPVSNYEPPFAFAGAFIKFGDDHALDGDGVGRARLTSE